MNKRFQIRDPVHNFIELEAEERMLVGTPLFQRLRGIRQLAMAYLVYPGAVHTRFDHSLGVCSVAGRMAAALQLDEKEHEPRDVRFAALLHDIGHGPFSHVSEYSLARYALETAVPPGAKRTKIHELVTTGFLEADPDIGRILGKERTQRVADLLRGKAGRPLMQSIVSGPLDADKQDYLLRDSRFCGVPYGVFDLEQLHRSMRTGGEDGQELVIDPDGAHAVEQYALAKYFMTANVYRHKVRIITDRMLVRAVELGIDEDHNDALRALYEFDGSPEFLLRYRQWDDARFVQEFSQLPPEKSLCSTLVRRLRDRRLLRRVFHSRLSRDAFPPAARDVLGEISEIENRDIRMKVERAAAEVLKAADESVDHRMVIAHAYRIDSVRKTVKNDSQGVMVQARGQQPVPFDEFSALFKSIDSGIDDRFIDVYAPVEWANHSKRDHLLAKIEDEMKKAITSAVDENLFGGAA